MTWFPSFDWTQSNEFDKEILNWFTVQHCIVSQLFDYDERQDKKKTAADANPETFAQDYESVRALSQESAGDIRPSV